LALRRAQFAGIADRLRTPRETIDAKAQLLAGEWRAFTAALGRYLGDTRQRAERAGDRVSSLADRLARAMRGGLEQRAATLDGSGKLLDSYSFRGTLARGFVLVRDAAGHVVVSAEAAVPGSAVRLDFADGAVGATIDPAGKPMAAPSARASPAATGAPAAARSRRGGGPQGSLF
jgi:exodeoxyribonuclease VII large subunit